MSELVFECVAIVGMGMMGGSLGLGLRQRQIAARVVGVDVNASALARARDIGASDAGTTDLAVGVREADCIVLAAPVRVICDLLPMLAPLARPDALVTDIGSTKRRIVQTGAQCFGPRFVGGHPMAGSPQGGIDAALPDLFANAAWGVVREHAPDLDADLYAQQIARMALRLNARPIALDSARHDQLVALVSHLPHVLSFAFADLITASPDPDLAQQMAGGSYRDIMRVSGADRAFWQEIFRENRDALEQMIAGYEARLQTLKSLISGEEKEGVPFHT